jgi:hypothetical protein
MGSVSNRDIHIRHYDAVEQADGSWLHNDGEIFWYNADGHIHREDGPTFKHRAAYPNKIEWFFNGNSYKFNDWLKLTTITDEAKMLLRLQYG